MKKFKEKGRTIEAMQWKGSYQGIKKICDAFGLWFPLQLIDMEGNLVGFTFDSENDARVYRVQPQDWVGRRGSTMCVYSEDQLEDYFEEVKE